MHVCAVFELSTFGGFRRAGWESQTGRALRGAHSKYNRGPSVCAGLGTRLHIPKARPQGF